jgi:murein L,D-transpeptidase YcbB/YkuD
MSKSSLPRLIGCVPYRKVLLAAGLLLATPLPGLAAEPSAEAALQAALVEQASGELRGFYAHRDGPLWVTREGALRPAAHELARLIRTAEYDGLDPAQLRGGALEAALRGVQRDRSPAALARAELALSSAFARYVEAMARQPAGRETIYEHDVLRPLAPTGTTVLQAAANARSIDDYISNMRWMHPLYAQIRQSLAARPQALQVRQAAQASLARLRAIPAAPWSRHIVIDIASARLWMYEGDRAVDSMRIVVGKPDTPTPMMAGYIRHAVLNPYWNVPEHLVRKTIAAGVLSQGPGYLRARGYEVLSDWSDDPRRLDPARIDWRAVADGRREVRVRQNPGATNAMGTVKFEFPNPEGIYLHDTPDKDLLLADARQFSNGCVRLEDAERLGRWLLGGAMPSAGRPETRIDLRQPVPIYITYLTVQAEGERVALGSDPYGRDGSARATPLARAH